MVQFKNKFNSDLIYTSDKIKSNYSSYKAVWRIPKLITIAYEKVFISRN